MDDAEIARYLTDTFADVQVETSEDNRFFYRGTDRSAPFATIVTNDAYDHFSALGRSAVFRVSMAVGRPTFEAIAGTRPDRAEDDSIDFTLLDRLLPHPVDGPRHWVCVLNPSRSTFHDRLEPLLAEAHALAVARTTRRPPPPAAPGAGGPPA